MTFASLLYETFMKQNRWHEIEEHIHAVEPFIQGHELYVSIFKAKDLEEAYENEHGSSFARVIL
jgi:hypothetical protein